MSPAAAALEPSRLLGTIARFAVVAGGLSTVAPYFLGLSATLGAMALVAWVVERPSAPRRPAPQPRTGRRSWAVVLPVTIGGWAAALGAVGGWGITRGPAIALTCVALWYSVRPATAGGGRHP